VASASVSEQTRLTIIELYTKEKLGIKAISAWFKGKPGKTTVARVLTEAGLYQGPDRVAEQRATQERRRSAIIQREKELRHQLAVCLLELRRGIPVATTCRKNGWSKTGVLNPLNRRTSYRKFKARTTQPRSRPERDYRNGWVSRQFPHEETFQEYVEALLRSAKAVFEREFRLPNEASRVDFRVGEVLIECKVDVRTGSMNEAIGQTVLYSIATNLPVVILLPEDVVPRPIHLAALQKVGAHLWRPARLTAWLERAC